MSGGSFKDGFLGAGFAALAGLAIKSWPSELQFAARTIIGGIAAEAGGGQFSNGALSAAFAYAFNDLLHGRDVTATEGQSIVEGAASFKGTPYLFGGDTSAGADCSGSTYCIYRGAGFPYEKMDTARFDAMARAENNFPFRPLNVNEAHQPGDVILFKGHMSIYAGSVNGTDMMWTATHTGGPGYLQMPVKFWPSAPIGWYRYQVPAGQ